MPQGATVDSPRMEFQPVRYHTFAQSPGSSQPIGDDAATITQAGWVQDVLDGYWGRTSIAGHSIDTNMIIDNWQYSADTFRRADLAGSAMMPYTGGPQGPFDVVFSFPADPSPDMRGEYAYTSYDEATRSFRVKIRKSLGDPALPPPGNTVEFVKETIAHELGHVMLGLLFESWGDAYVKAKLAECLGAGPWNTGPWEGRLLESAVEAWKDLTWPPRVFNNRTRRTLRHSKRRKFQELMIHSQRVPGGRGPVSRVMGDIATDLVESYSGHVDGWPQPAPEYDWNLTIPTPYEFPILSGGLGAINQRLGFSWLWGGRNPTPNLAPKTPLGLSGAGGWWGVPEVTDDPYLTPPPPGSKVKFVARWDDPIGEFPTTRYLDYAASAEPGKKPPLPAGVISIDTGGPPQVNSAGLKIFGTSYAQNVSGLVWMVGTSGRSTWDDFVLPPELPVTWLEIDFVDIEHALVLERFEPIYFDCRRANTFELELTVPDHNGELGINWLWSNPGFSVQDFVSGEIHEPMPVRCYPTGRRTASYAKPTKPQDVQFPQGDVEVGDPSRGTHRHQHLVVGSLREAIPLIDPGAEEIEITVR